MWHPTSLVHPFGSHNEGSGKKLNHSRAIKGANEIKNWIYYPYKYYLTFFYKQNCSKSVQEVEEENGLALIVDGG